MIKVMWHLQGGFYLFIFYFNLIRHAAKTENSLHLFYLKNSWKIKKYFSCFTIKTTARQSNKNDSEGPKLVKDCWNAWKSVEILERKHWKGQKTKFEKRLKIVCSTERWEQVKIRWKLGKRSRSGQKGFWFVKNKEKFGKMVRK